MSVLLLERLPNLCNTMATLMGNGSVAWTVVSGLMKGPTLSHSQLKDALFIQNYSLDLELVNSMMLTLFL